MFGARYQYLREIIYLFGEDRKKLPVLFVLFFSASLLDLVGISLIGPYISIAFNTEMSNPFINSIINFFQLPKDGVQLVIIFGVVLISIFITKLCSQI